MNRFDTDNATRHVDTLRRIARDKKESAVFREVFASYGTKDRANDRGKDNDNNVVNYVGDNARVETNVATDNRVVNVFEVKSYGIGKTWNLLRHVYLRFRNVEIHSGMTDPHEHFGPVCVSSNYYGCGRTDGYFVYCDECADCLLSDMIEKNKSFNIAFNNCDTITPVILQTPVIWFAVLGGVIGGLCSVIYRDGEFDAFVALLLAPLFALAVLLFYNTFDDDQRILIVRCSHVPIESSVSRSFERNESM